MILNTNRGRKKLSLHHGMTLIEILIALSLTSIVFLSLISTFQYFSGGIKNSRTQSGIDQIMDEVAIAISKNPSCTRNLHEKTFDRNGELDLSNIIRYTNDTSGGGTVVLSKGAYYKDADARVTKITLKRKMNLTGGEAPHYDAAELTVEFESKRPVFSYSCSGSGENQTITTNLDSGAGAMRFSRTVGLVVGITYGPTFDYIESCYTEESTNNERLCSLASNGSQYYDSTSETCKTRYRYQSFNGTKDFAQCEEGWALKASGPCSVISPSGFSRAVYNATAPSVDAEYTTPDPNVTSPNVPQPVDPWKTTRDTSNNSCSCRYNSFIETMDGYESWGSEFICVANCEQPL